MSSLLLYIQRKLIEDTSHFFAFLATEATTSLPLCVKKKDRMLGFLNNMQIQLYISGGKKTETLHCTNIRIHINFKSSQISDSKNEIFTHIMQFLIFLIFSYPAFTKMQWFKLKGLSFSSSLGDIHLHGGGMSSA